jgi:hypothetical protein
LRSATPARTPEDPAMTDPYNNNPYAAPASASVVAAPRLQPPSIDRISRLDVSDSWKEIFRLFERAGGVGMKRARELDNKGRRKLTSNWLAFFFGPFYFLAKGLWRQALVWLLIWIAVVVVCVSMHWEGMLRAIGAGLNVAFMMRANAGYYASKVLGEPIWF